MKLRNRMIAESDFIAARSYFFCSAVASHFAAFGTYPTWEILRKYFTSAGELAMARLQRKAS